MKTPYPNLSLFLHFFALLAGVSLHVQAVFAADEICISCGPQVSVSGSFTHHKDGPSVAIEGTFTDPSVFREDVNGTNFTVTISQLPAGRYTIRLVLWKQFQAGRVKGCLTWPSATMFWRKI